MVQALQIASLFATAEIKDSITPSLQDIDKNLSGFAKNMGSRLKDIGQTLTVGLTLPIIGFLGASVKSAADSEAAIAQLNAVLKSTKGVAGVTAKSAQLLASGLEEITGYSDEAVLGAENMLLTFTKIGKDIFPQVTETVLDMSTALGQDLKSSAIQLGKALQDPIEGVTALRRVGVNFNKQQMETIKTLVKEGKTLAAQKLILKELKTEFGGSAEAAGSTFGGEINKLKNNLDNLMETIGGAIIPVLTPFVFKLDNILGSLTRLNPEILRMGLIAAAVVAGIGPLLGILGALATAIGFILSPVGLLLVAIAAIGIAFATNFGGIRDAVMPVIQGLVDALKGIWERVRPSLDMLAGWFINGAVPDIINIIKTSVLPVIQDFIDFLGRLWSDVQPALDSLFDWFKTQGLPAILSFISNQALPTIKKIIDAFKAIWDEVRPKLEALFSWFMNEGLPTIGRLLSEFKTNYVDPVISVLKDLWTVVEPALQALADWFTNTGLPTIKQALGEIKEKWIDPVIAAFQSIWDAVQPKLKEFANWFHENLPKIKKLFNDSIGAIIKLIDDLIKKIDDALSKLPKLGTPGGWNLMGTTTKSMFNQDQSKSNPLNDLFGGFFGHRAAGGPVTAGGSYVVGERGPELFTPRTAGMVTAGGGRPQMIHIVLQADNFADHLYVNVADQIRSRGRS